jgi:hypothetical protein
LLQLIEGPIDEYIIGEVGLYWLVNVKHIGFVVKGPGIESGAVGIVVDVFTPVRQYERFTNRTLRLINRK